MLEATQCVLQEQQELILIDFQLLANARLFHHLALTLLFTPAALLRALLPLIKPALS